MILERSQTHPMQRTYIDLDRTDKHRCMDQPLHLLTQLLGSLIGRERTQLQVQPAVQCGCLCSLAGRLRLRAYRRAGTILSLPGHRIDTFHLDPGGPPLGKSQLHRTGVG